MDDGGSAAKPPEAAVVEIGLGHALRFTRHLDPALTERARKARVDTRRHMATVVRASAAVHGLSIDGELVAIGGVGRGLLGPAGVWLALGENARRHRMALVRHAREELAKVLDRHGSVSALIAADDAAGRRFAEFLGFRLAHTDDTDWLVATLDRGE